MKKKNKLDKLQERLAGANKRIRGLRESKGVDTAFKVGAAAGTFGAASGMLDGAVNLIPGGHLGHTDYIKAPSSLRYKRTLVFGSLAAAAALLLKGPEQAIATPLAALAGRAHAQHRATYYKKTAARSPEDLAKDIGAEQAAKVTAADGYKQV